MAGVCMTVSGPQRTYCKVNASEVGRSISFINNIAYTKEGVLADGKMLNLSSFSLIIASNRSFNKHCCILLNSLMLKKITCLSTRLYAPFLPFEKNHNWDHAHSSVLKAVDKFLIGG